MLDQSTWLLIALGLGGIFLLLALGGIVVLVVANKKRIDASPALPTVNRNATEDVVVDDPFANTEFTTTKAAAPVQTNPLSRRSVRQEPSPEIPRQTPARSFFAEDDDDDFDFTSGRD